MKTISIKISDECIKRMSDIDANIKEGCNGKDVLDVLAANIFNNLGKDEFTIDPDEISDEKESEMLKKVLVPLMVICSTKENKQ